MCCARLCGRRHPARGPSGAMGASGSLIPLPDCRLSMQPKQLPARRRTGGATACIVKRRIELNAQLLLSYCNVCLAGHADIQPDVPQRLRAHGSVQRLPRRWRHGCGVGLRPAAAVLPDLPTVRGHRRNSRRSHVALRRRHLAGACCSARHHMCSGPRII